jgi:hypothetical protein
MGKFCCLLVLAVCVLVSSCSKDDEDKKQTVATRSVLVYISGENSLNSYVASDVNEMLRAKSVLGDDDNLILYVDDTDYPRFYEIKNNTSATSFARLTPVKTYSEEMDSATPETFRKILDYFFNHYKAESYGLVMWSHGSGWVNDPSNQTDESRTESTLTDESQTDEALSDDSSSASSSLASFAGVRKTICVDNGRNTTSDSGTRMEVVDMASVLETFPKFEFIMFDACFMQGMEVAYELRNSANYIIGSPAETPGEGAPYQNVLAPMFANPFNPQPLVYNYYSYYGEYTSYGVVISAIKTDEFSEFVPVMQDLLASYSFLNDSLYSYSDCLDYFLYSWNFSRTSDVMPYPDYYDIQGIMLKVLSSEDYAKWKTAFDKLVPYKYASAGWYSSYKRGSMVVDQNQCGGVNMYLPLSKYSSNKFFSYYGRTAWGEAMWCSTDSI